MESYKSCTECPTQKFKIESLKLDKHLEFIGRKKEEFDSELLNLYKKYLNDTGAHSITIKSFLMEKTTNELPKQSVLFHYNIEDLKDHLSAK